MATKDNVDVSKYSYQRQVKKCLTLLSDNPRDTGCTNGDSTCCICRRKGDVTPTSHQCVSCGDTLCEKCQKGHRSSSATHAHVVVTLSEIKDKNIKVKAWKVFSCENHKERRYEYFCGTCSKSLCSVCVISSHMKHEIAPLHDLASQRRKQISDLSKTILEDVENPIWKTNMFNRHRDILNSIEKITLMKVREKSQALIEHILQREKDLVKQVKYLCDQQRLVLECHENDLKEALEGAKTVAELSKEIVQDGCDEEVVIVSDDVRKCLDVKIVSQFQENILEHVANLKTPVYEIQCTFPQSSPLTVTEDFIEKKLSNLPDVVETSTLVNEVENCHSNSQEWPFDLKTDSNGVSASQDDTKDIRGELATMGEETKTVMVEGRESIGVTAQVDHTPLNITVDETDIRVDSTLCKKEEGMVSSSYITRFDKDPNTSHTEGVLEKPGAVDVSATDDSKLKCVSQNVMPGTTALVKVCPKEHAIDSDIKAVSSLDDEETKGLDIVDSTFKKLHTSTASSSEPTPLEPQLLHDEVNEDDDTVNDDDVDVDDEDNDLQDGMIFRVTSSLSIVGDYGRSLRSDCSSGQTDMVDEKDYDSSSARSSSVDLSSTFTPTSLDCDVIPFDSFPQVTFGSFGPKFFVPYLDRIKSKRDSQNAMCLIKEETVTLTQPAKDSSSLIVLGMSLVGEDKLAVLDGGNNRVQLFTMSGKLCNKNHPNKLTEPLSPHSVACIGNRVVYISGARIYVTDMCLNLLHHISLSTSEKDKSLLPLCLYKENSVLIANLPKDKISIYNIIDNKIEEKGLGFNGPVVAVCQYRENMFLFSSWNKTGWVHLISSTGSLVRAYRPRGLDTWHPEGVCVDSQLNVYVASPKEGKVYVFGNDGTQIYELKCELPSPTCLVMKSDNTLIVSGLGSVLHTFKCTFYKKS